jgi:hypothetical protein
MISFFAVEVIEGIGTHKPPLGEADNTFFAIGIVA